MSRSRSNEGLGTFLSLLGLGAAAYFFAKIATSPKASPALQFIAQTAEGTLVQDLETGLFHLLV